MTRRSRHLAWRRNWWLMAALAGFTAAMLVLMGTEAVVPYTSSKSLAAQTKIDAAAKAEAIAAANGLAGQNVTSSIDMFDVNIVHTVEITMDPTEYDTMISDYQRDGLKTWHPATVVIDGTRLDQVGMRLKGNSTLIGLRYSGPESPPNPGGLASIFPPIFNTEPHKMPFLLRFDEFLPGQRYQGVNELALRAAGFGDSTQLTELLANLLTRDSGQPYLRTSTGGMSMNGSQEGYFLLVEHPDDYWAQRMIPGDQEPALYKATPGASFHYFGEDPAKYAGVFNQQAETRSIGPGPMIDFLRFVEKSSDRTFAVRLADHLDVDEFARYLAFHNLIVDTDSFAGTGNNYYFLYDPKTKQMSIAPWDQNTAFGLLGGARYRPYYEDGAALPGGDAFNVEGIEEFDDGGTGLGEENLLMRRFFDTPKFRKLYDRIYRELFEELLRSGRADALMGELASAIQASAAERDLIGPTSFDSAVRGKSGFVADRIEYLETQPIIAG